MKPSLASRVVAVVIVSVLLAGPSHFADNALLRRASSMTDAEVAQYYRDVHSHSVVFNGLSMLMMGMVFVMCVEFVSHLVRRFWRRMDPVAMAGT